MALITLDILRQRYADLDFRLEYRIKLEDGVIKKNNQLSDEIAAWLDDVCSAYLQASAGDRGTIRALFDDDDKRWCLFVLFGRLCDSIRHPQDEPIAEKAAALLSIEEAKFDPRDWQMHLRRLIRVGTSAGVELARVLTKVAAVSGSGVSNGISVRSAFGDLAMQLKVAKGV